jgi:hypothetical protein
VFAASLTNFRAGSVCIPDQASPTVLFFTGERLTGATPMAGVYRVSLTGGQVPQGAAVPTAVFEATRDGAGTAVVYGACLNAGGEAGKLVFTRWTTGGPGATGGRVSSCALPTCTPVDVVTPAAGFDLAALPGLARSGTTLFVSELAGRVFRIDGFF